MPTLAPTLRKVGTCATITAFLRALAAQATAPAQGHPAAPACHGAAVALGTLADTKN